MNPKTSLTIFAMILLIGIMASGIISAGRELSDVSDKITIDDFVAGSTAQATFSYNYIEGVADNVDNSPFILKFNITSSNENYPVWKNDFSINGKIRRYRLFGLFLREILFDCSEISPLTINHPIGKVTLNNVPNGTFYCYNPEGDLKLDRHDEVFLNIKSHPALWPGQYNLKAELFYLEDIYPPIVTILNKSYFDQYFRDGSYVDFEVEIIDVNFVDYNAKIIAPGQNFSFSKQHVSGNIYHFYMTLPYNIPEGYWDVLVTGIDSEGNIGSDNATIGIDLTPPEIELIEPTDGIYSEIIPIKFNVTDEKAGVDNETVQARLREIKEGIGICPETGGPINGTGCVTTPWINLALNLTNGLFEVDVNTDYYNLTSGSYWLEARAKDILGNKAEWIA